MAETGDFGVPSSYKRILLGYDGSDNAMRALQSAITMTKEGGGTLSVIVVADTLSYQSRYMMRYYKHLRDDIIRYAKEQLSKAIETAEAKGITSVQGAVEEGHPAEMILARASDANADLIIVGRRGLRGIQKYLLGSVSSSIVSHSTCDVMVIK